MLSNLKLLFPLLLIIITCATSYMSYHMYGKYKVEHSLYTESQQKLSDANTAMDKLSAGCKISESVSTVVNKATDTAQQNLSTIMGKLSTIKQNEVKHEKTNVLSGDKPISDAKLSRLLDDAYCTAVPSDSYCSTRQSSSNKASN